ncbi:DUF1542 domain-containing protein [Weissella hellenica]|uniref:DUF1542 domain-containing protein n=2 Tax=Weissella hellenica TaxID=46256 RepID=A0A4Y4G8G3_WEIHE|nr:DUF1542 domain-containing protein [Weissella hellenica]NKY67439.1 DUF1542 domain-containing protein [Weissella hellenica]GED36440.1 hypothetical protein WHE01_13440 [Weissella hellenica]SCC07846.1 KxYKxGKxW signal peptide containing protein [Weissella hellenica]
MKRVVKVQLDVRSHYKSYKIGKMWVTALAGMTIGTMGFLGNVNADQVTPVQQSASIQVNDNDIDSSPELENSTEMTSQASDIVTTDSSSDEQVSTSVNSETASSTVSSEVTVVDNKTDKTDVVTEQSPITSEVSDIQTSSSIVDSEATIEKIQEETVSTSAVTAATVDTTQTEQDLTNQTITETPVSNEVNVSADKGEGVEQTTKDNTEQVKQPVVADASVNESVPTVENKAGDELPEGSVVVNTAEEFVNAIATGTSSDIYVDSDIDLAGYKNGLLNLPTISVTSHRDMTVQSTSEQRHKIDFNKFTFDMATILVPTNRIYLKNLDLLGTNTSGIFSKADSYAVEDVTYQGGTFISTNNRVDILGTVTVDTTANGSPAISANEINFKEGSNFTGTTTNGDVLYTNVDITNITNDHNGIFLGGQANVSLNPHGDGKYAINASAADVIVNDGAELHINLNSIDNAKTSGVIHLHVLIESKINVEKNALLDIQSNGVPSVSAINISPDNLLNFSGKGQINVDNDATFNYVGQDMGDFAGSVFYITGGSTFNVNPNATFTAKIDGTGAVKLIDLGSAISKGYFNIVQPKHFLIDRTANTNDQTSFMTNGTLNFSKIKVMDDQGNYSDSLDTMNLNFSQFLGFYASNASDVVGKTEAVETQINNQFQNNTKGILDVIRSGEDVFQENVALDKNNRLTANISNVMADSDAFVQIQIKHADGSIDILPAVNTVDSPYWRDTDKYGQLTDEKGAFSFDLSNANVQNDDTIIIKTTREFVTDNQEYSVDQLRLAQVQSDNKNALLAYGEEQKQVITDLANVSDEQRLAAQAAIDAEVATGIDDIDKATTTVEADAAFNTGTHNIDGIVVDVVLVDSKLSAKKSIDNAAQTAKNELVNNVNLTDEERTAIETEIDAAVTTAKDNIDSAVTTDDVDVAQVTGETVIADIDKAGHVKAEAKTAIDKVAEAAKAEVAGNVTLTVEEKATINAAIDEATQTAKEAITSATTDVEVAAAQVAGEAAIDAVDQMAVTKPTAETAIDNAAEVAKGEVAGNANLTVEEQATATAAIDEAAQAAKEAITSATTNDEVTAAQVAGEAAIGGVDQVAVVKPTAEGAIDSAAEAAKGEVAKNTNT